MNSTVALNYTPSPQVRRVRLPDHRTVYADANQTKKHFNQASNNLKVYQSH